MSLVVLVCGGRKFRNAMAIYEDLGALHREHVISYVMEGGAAGADSIAADWAQDFGVPLVVFPAEWNHYRKSAGPRRNRWMFDFRRPDLVLAYPDPDSRGTWGMVKIARDAGVQVNVHEAS